MLNLQESFSYKGPVFDAHAHVIDMDGLDLFVKVGDQYGVEKSVLIVHGDRIDHYMKHYPHRFIYAKYFSGWTLFTEGPESSIEQVTKMREEGYGMAKMHFAPFWSDRLEVDSVPEVDDDMFDRFFDVLADEDIPIVIHIGDPDTYFATRYNDPKVYGTKEEHIAEFENRLKKSTENRFQVAHFCAQPEPHRLDNLSRMLENYPNMNIDTGSARWMSRELSKDRSHAKELFLKYADRIIFATDCVARSLDRNYYDGRYKALRLLLETDIEQEPLPFVDKDTVGKGGTFINGLDLPESVLEKVYWENAAQLHGI